MKTLLTFKTMITAVIDGTHIQGSLDLFYREDFGLMNFRLIHQCSYLSLTIPVKDNRAFFRGEYLNLKELSEEGAENLTERVLGYLYRLCFCFETRREEAERLYRQYLEGGEHDRRCAEEALWEEDMERMEEMAECDSGNDNDLRKEAAGIIERLSMKRGTGANSLVKAIAELCNMEEDASLVEQLLRMYVDRNAIIIE